MSRPARRHPLTIASIDDRQAGEGTAIVTGRGQSNIADIDGLAPYRHDDDLVILGVRDYLTYRS